MKHRVISVDDVVDDDVDDSSAAVEDKLPPPHRGRGVNTTLPEFLRPELLSHSMRSGRTTTVSRDVQLKKQPRSDETCGRGCYYLRASFFSGQPIKQKKGRNKKKCVIRDCDPPLSREVLISPESQTPHAYGPPALAERRGTAATIVVAVGTIPTSATTPIIDESHVFDRMEKFAPRPACDTRRRPQKPKTNKRRTG